MVFDVAELFEYSYRYINLMSSSCISTDKLTLPEKTNEEKQFLNVVALLFTDK